MGKGEGTPATKSARAVAREALVERFAELAGCAPLGYLRNCVQIFETRAPFKVPNPATPPTPDVTFLDFAEALELIDDLGKDRRDYGGENGSDPGDLAVLICNKGDGRDRAEAFLALLPIAKQVYARWQEADDAGEAS